MKISALIEVARKKGVYQLFADNLLIGMVDSETIYYNKIAVGSVFSDDVMKNILAESEERLAKEYAFSHLAGGIYTEYQCRKKLKDKGFGENAVNFAIKSLAEYGFVDDEKVAESFVREFSMKKGVLRLRVELSNRGVSKAIIQKVTLKLDNQEESALAISKKFAENYPLSEKKNKEKLIRRLQYKGFDWQTISNCLKKLGEVSDEME